MIYADRFKYQELTSHEELSRFDARSRTWATAATRTLLREVRENSRVSMTSHREIVLIENRQQKEEGMVPIDDWRRRPILDFPFESHFLLSHFLFIFLNLFGTRNFFSGICGRTFGDTRMIVTTVYEFIARTVACKN